MPTLVTFAKVNRQGERETRYEASAEVNLGGHSLLSLLAWRVFHHDEAPPDRPIPRFPEGET